MGLDSHPCVTCYLLHQVDIGVFSIPPRITLNLNFSPPSQARGMATLTEHCMSPVGIRNSNNVRGERKHTVWVVQSLSIGVERSE